MAQTLGSHGGVTCYILLLTPNHHVGTRLLRIGFAAHRPTRHDNVMQGTLKSPEWTGPRALGPYLPSSWNATLDGEADGERITHT